MDQQKVWWKTTAWRYRNPEANEPSDTALGMQRVAFFVIAIMFLGIAGIVKAADNANDYSTARVRVVAQTLETRLDQGTIADLRSSFGSTSDLNEVVQAEGDGKVKIRAVGDDQYELTNRKGENPVCLTLTFDNQPHHRGDQPFNNPIITSLNDGPC
ncbi:MULTISPECIES: hypothetical protein [unclassified Spirillospora]|uniref:hypothetical protein n=1 Tax=unclassified Spirillospora TaxID=2642701 RepID=UPI0037211AFD